MCGVRRASISFIVPLAAAVAKLRIEIRGPSPHTVYSGERHTGHFYATSARFWYGICSLAAACRFVFASRRSEPAVVLTDAWPIIFWTVAMSAPASVPTDMPTSPFQPCLLAIPEDYGLSCNRLLVHGFIVFDPSSMRVRPVVPLRLTVLSVDVASNLMWYSVGVNPSNSPGQTPIALSVEWPLMLTPH